MRNAKYNKSPRDLGEGSYVQYQRSALWGSGSGEQEKINLLGPFCVSVFSQKTLPVATEEGMELGNGKDPTSLQF